MAIPSALLKGLYVAYAKGTNPDGKLEYSEPIKTKDLTSSVCA